MESAAPMSLRSVPAAEPLTVRPFAGADAARWEAFVERCPEATFFHRIGWREIIDLGGIATSRGAEMYVLLWHTLRNAISSPRFNIKVVT